MLVDPHNTAEIADSLTQLITNPDLRQQLVEQGYQQIQKFLWQKAAARHPQKREEFIIHHSEFIICDGALLCR